MRHFEEFYSNTFNCTMKQVNVKKARRLFNEGHTVYLHPSKMRFDNVWQSPIPISKDYYDKAIIGNFAAEPFDNAINHFVYYNCDGERGKGVHYFIQVT